MVPQIAGGPHIPRIKEMTDESGSGVALICHAVEHMSFVFVDIFDCPKRFEENIYRCVPVLLELS